MSEWQPIETAPRGTPVLVFDSGDVSVAVYQPSTGKWCGLVDGGLVGVPRQGQESIWFLVGKPSHWMPLPTPPKRDTRRILKVGELPEDVVEAIKNTKMKD